MNNKKTHNEIFSRNTATNIPAIIIQIKKKQIRVNKELINELDI